MTAFTLTTGPSRPLRGAAADPEDVRQLRMNLPLAGYDERGDDQGLALLPFSRLPPRSGGESYALGDWLVWFADVPKDRPECRSPFLTDKPTEFAELWLEFRKKRMPTRPALPLSVVEWVRPD